MGCSCNDVSLPPTAFGVVVYYYHLTTHSHCLLVVLSSTFSTSWACSAWTLSRRKSVLISLTTREQPTTYRDPPRRRLRSSRSRQASASLRSRKTTRKAMKKMLLKSIEGNLGPVLFSTSCLSFGVTSVSFLYSFVIINCYKWSQFQSEGGIHFAPPCDTDDSVSSRERTCPLIS